MSRLKEAFSAARQRANPDGLAISAGLSPGFSIIGAPVAAGIALGAHEVMQYTDQDLAGVIAIGIIGLANILSIATEAKTLQSKKYCASPIASTLQVLSDKPLFSSAGAHLINLAELALLNPVNTVAAVTGNGQLLLESAGSTAFTLALWFTTMNYLIIKGKIDPVANGIKKVRESVVNRLKKQPPTPPQQPIGY